MDIRGKKKLSPLQKGTVQQTRIKASEARRITQINKSVLSKARGEKDDDDDDTITVSTHVQVHGKQTSWDKH